MVEQRFGRTVAVAALVLSAAVTPAAAQDVVAVKTAAEQQRARFEISQMERILQGAVENGATLIRDRLQAALPGPAQMMLSENARVRGFRLDGYGVFFDVEVPALEGGMLLWSYRTLDQNDLGLDSALKTLKSYIDRVDDVNVQQALKRVELQVASSGPAPPAAATPASTGARAATGTPAALAEATAADAILADPREAYRTEIKQQIMETMLNYSTPLAIGADEWLTIAARARDDRPLVSPADNDMRTVIIRIRGGDLAAFRAGRATKDEALKRMDVRVF